MFIPNSLAKTSLSFVFIAVVLVDNVFAVFAIVIIVVDVDVVSSLSPAGLRPKPEFSPEIVCHKVFIEVNEISGHQKKKWELMAAEKRTKLDFLDKNKSRKDES